MQTAKAIQEIIRERGRKGLPVERVYRLLFNPDLYLEAYGKIYRNKGAMTPGTTGETVDGMSMDKINAIIELLRYERYQWSPARRVYIPKKNGKKRPLGIPSWSDKLLQEVIRTILEAYYEPQFKDQSHGFRPGRGCHTALEEIRKNWVGTAWFIEGDIKGCFDHINHTVLLDIMREKFHDGRFIQLISDMLDAGYMEEWAYHQTYSGTPQGGVVSPILSNIYMHKLDEFITGKLIPAWTRGGRRRGNPTYQGMMQRIRHLKRRGRAEEAKKIWKEMVKLPSVDTTDQGYRRLRYVRYADDFLLGLAGPKSEAEQIKEQIREFLQDTLKLELSQDKTLVTHARTGAAKFLGYEIHVFQADDHKMQKRRTLNGGIGLRVPEAVVHEKCQRYMSSGKPRHRTERMKESDYTILADYQSEYRGMVNYWAMAYNLPRLRKLRWVMEQSLTKTLANKFKMSVSEVYRKYHATTTVNQRTYKVLRVTVERKGKEPLVAQWGGIPLIWNTKAALNDQVERIWNGRTELVQRLLAKECEYCGSDEHIEVHHIRGLKDLNRYREKPEWAKLMATRKRKTMVLCRECHQDVTYGRPMRNPPSGQGFMQDPKGWRKSRLRKATTVLESRVQ